MPAVFGCSNPFEGRTALYGCDAAILRVVAHTNVDRAAAAYDAHLLDGGHHLFGSFGARRGISLALIVICHSIFPGAFAVLR